MSRDEGEGYSNMLAAMMLSGPETPPETTFAPELTPAWPVTDLAAFRAELARWLHDSWDPSITVREWWARMAAAGLTMPTWPRTAGGISAPTAVQQLIEREFAAAGLVGPPLRGGSLRLIGPALRQHTTPRQAERLLRPLMRGEHTWCVLIDEHDADLADIETTAVLDGSTYMLTGGKVWSSSVPEADWAFVLARTDRKAHVKRALTCFAVDMAHDGVSMTDARAKPRLVKFDRVPAEHDDAIGGVGAGWAVAQTVVAHMQTSLAGRIRRGVVDVAPGTAAGNLDRTVAEVVAAYEPRPKRKQRRVEPGSDRRHSSDFT
jgi:alkylation response protein AidB-like acyl-CoA dehydrogenase